MLPVATGYHLFVRFVSSSAFTNDSVRMAFLIWRLALILRQVREQKSEAQLALARSHGESTPHGKRGDKW